MKNIEILQDTRHDVLIVTNKNEEYGWGYHCQTTTSKETTLHLLENMSEKRDEAFTIKCIVQYMKQV